MPLSLEKSAAPQEEFADEDDDDDDEEEEEEEQDVVENDDSELQEDNVNSLPSLEHVSISFLEISFMERVNRVSAVSGNSRSGGVSAEAARGDMVVERHSSNVFGPMDLLLVAMPNKSLDKFIPPKMLWANKLNSFPDSWLTWLL